MFSRRYIIFVGNKGRSFHSKFRGLWIWKRDHLFAQRSSICRGVCVRFVWSSPSILSVTYTHIFFSCSINRGNVGLPKGCFYYYFHSHSCIHRHRRRHIIIEAILIVICSFFDLLHSFTFLYFSFNKSRDKQKDLSIVWIHSIILFPDNEATS